MLIGDSALFGPALDDEKTIAERLRKITKACIINTAVIGFNSAHYLDVLRYWLEKAKLDHVLVFWCLNDAQNDTSFVQKSYLTNAFDFALARLRSRSKFYMALKNFISDRSKAYFLYDRQFYQSGNPQFARVMQDLSEMKNLCDQGQTGFDVVLLPYEYQIRNRAVEWIWAPQELLQSYLEQQGINCLRIDFQEFGGNAAKELYLYADGIHFSKLGHQEIAERVGQYLVAVE